MSLRPAQPIALLVLLVAAAATNLPAADPGGITDTAGLGPVSERALKIHHEALLFDGHNDLPWRLRSDGDVAFGRLDLAGRLDSGHTDIPRIRAGGLDAQYWSVYIPSEHPDPARTVLEQIDVVHRMIERYPETFALALSADDVERIVAEGKVASLIGVEGGVAIENNLALLRTFARLGVRYMTLTHNSSLDWADAATDEPRSGGLSPFGERVVREMNRLGILVDISHVSPETMQAVLRVSEAPILASHSSAYAICPHPRNVPDDVLTLLPANGGVVMVNFYSAFVNGEAHRLVEEARTALREQHPDPAEYRRALREWYRANELPPATIGQVADHIDHIVQVAGIDHVGIGGDYDGIDSTPVGLEDVSCYPRLTEELLNRGYSEEDIRKILGGNALRALREAGRVAERLRAEVDAPSGGEAG